jgi:hypothetical protein
VGIELSGEIRSAYRTGKDIHIIESHNTVLDNLTVPVSDQMKQRVIQLLERNKVTLHFEQRVDLNSLNVALEQQNGASGINIPVLDCTESAPFLLQTSTGEQVLHAQLRPPLGMSLT